MDNFHTPVKKPFQHLTGPVTVPPSPFLKKLGYGTGVAVYKLERSPVANQVQSPWAIKKLIKVNSFNSTTYGKRLKEEASILRKLEHPNIIGFRGFLRTKDNQDCLAMEECSACLGNMIEERREDGLEAYPAKTIMKVANDIAEALNYLHTQALLLHCDVKSYNILIKDNFSVCKLCDFGVSLPLTPTGELDREKAGEDAEHVGTRLWSAPEIEQYPQVVTSKSDIYAYGLVIWEMLALKPPRLEMLDESMCETDELNKSLGEAACCERPELPPQDFDETYRFVLELFYCCTENDRKLRPSAQDLTISIPEMVKELNEI